MKKYNAKHALGTVLVCVGFLCLVIVLAGYLTYGSADPATYQVNAHGCHRRGKEPLRTLPQAARGTGGRFAHAV